MAPHSFWQFKCPYRSGSLPILGQRWRIMSLLRRKYTGRTPCTKYKPKISVHTDASCVICQQLELGPQNRITIFRRKSLRARYVLAVLPTRPNFCDIFAERCIHDILHYILTLQVFQLPGLYKKYNIPSFYIRLMIFKHLVSIYL